jgi:hypothetical protein
MSIKVRPEDMSRVGGPTGLGNQNIEERNYGGFEESGFAVNRPSQTPFARNRPIIPLRYGQQGPMKNFKKGGVVGYQDGGDVEWSQLAGGPPTRGKPEWSQLAGGPPSQGQQNYTQLAGGSPVRAGGARVHPDTALNPNYYPSGPAKSGGRRRGGGEGGESGGDPYIIPAKIGKFGTETKAARYKVPGEPAIILSSLAKGGPVEPQDDDTVYSGVGAKWSPESYEASLRKSYQRNDPDFAVGYARGGAVPNLNPMQMALSEERADEAWAAKKHKHGQQQPPPYSEFDDESYYAKGGEVVTKGFNGDDWQYDPARPNRGYTGDDLPDRHPLGQVLDYTRQQFGLHNIGKPQTGYAEGGEVEDENTVLQRELEARRSEEAIPANAQLTEGTVPPEVGNVQDSRSRSVRERLGDMMGLRGPEGQQRVQQEGAAGWRTRSMDPVLELPIEPLTGYAEKPSSRSTAAMPQGKPLSVRAPAETPQEELTSESGIGPLLRGAGSKLVSDVGSGIAEAGRTVAGTVADTASTIGTNIATGAAKDYGSLKDALAGYIRGDRGHPPDQVAQLYAEQGKNNPRGTHNEDTQKIFDAFMARNDFDGASKFTQALREPFDRTRAVGLGALRHGDMETALKAFQSAHNLLPNGTDISLRANKDGSVNAELSTGENFNLSKKQFTDWAHGPGSQFEHLADIGTSASLATAARAQNPYRPYGNITAAEASEAGYYMPPGTVADRVDSAWMRPAPTPTERTGLYRSEAEQTPSAAQAPLRGADIPVRPAESRAGWTPEGGLRQPPAEPKPPSYPPGVQLVQSTDPNIKVVTGPDGRVLANVGPGQKPPGPEEIQELRFSQHLNDIHTRAKRGDPVALAATRDPQSFVKGLGPEGTPTEQSRLQAQAYLARKNRNDRDPTTFAEYQLEQKAFGQLPPKSAMDFIAPPRASSAPRDTPATPATVVWSTNPKTGARTPHVVPGTPAHADQGAIHQAQFETQADIERYRQQVAGGAKSEAQQELHERRVELARAAAARELNATERLRLQDIHAKMSAGEKLTPEDETFRRNFNAIAAQHLARAQGQPGQQGQPAQQQEQVPGSYAPPPGKQWIQNPKTGQIMLWPP